MDALQARTKRREGWAPKRCGLGLERKENIAFVGAQAMIKYLIRFEGSGRTANMARYTNYET